MGPWVPFIYHLALLCKNWKERNKKKAQGLGQRGFSIELSTAVAVVVTCRRNTNIHGQKLCLNYYYYMERRHLQEAWAWIYKFNNYYGGHISTLQRCCEAIVQSFCGLLIIIMLFILTTKTEERYIAKETNRQ